MPSSIIPLEIWDCPGSVTLEQLAPLDQFASAIFFVDMVVSLFTTASLHLLCIDTAFMLRCA